MAVEVFTEIEELFINPNCSFLLMSIPKSSDRNLLTTSEFRDIPFCTQSRCANQLHQSCYWRTAMEKEKQSLLSSDGRPMACTYHRCYSFINVESIHCFNLVRCCFHYFQAVHKCILKALQIGLDRDVKNAAVDWQFTGLGNGCLNVTFQERSDFNNIPIPLG